ncbi:MAG: RnfABCDGE type electron transport complex subunit D [Candidatus Omnitrophota bacterium]
MRTLTISASPHISSPAGTADLMKDVIKALIPALAAGIYFFRGSAVGIIIASVAGCIFSEIFLQKIRKRPVETGNYSSLLTGLLLAMVLPPGLPLWMAFLGGAVAIGLGKEIFGGLGCNIFNPALLARAFLMAAFPVALTTWKQPITLDAVTTATPLGLAKFEGYATPFTQLAAGNVSGCVGETSAAALLAGIAYLLYKKVIDYRIPAAYVGTVAIFSLITRLISPDTYMGPVFHIFAGGLLLGAGFMATDPVTSPVTAKGRWVFGTGCGLVTMTIRLWGGLPEGVMYSILLMNACTPIINRFTRPRRFGVSRGGV